MNDEIKKALEEINILGNTILNDTTYKPTINRREVLYNYITNLQQKYEEANYDRHELFEEKVRLNEILVWKQEHEKELHTRIDKAIEYIQNNMQYDDNIEDSWVMTNDLLNILQNGSKDE